MTKLAEWLISGGVLLAAWLAVVTNAIDNDFTRDNRTFILYFPVILVVSFGISCLVLVLHRVFTFNNCDEAAQELQKEIIEAKEDLKKLGFEFKEINT